MKEAALFIDHYQNLGVHFTADENEIKKSFRKLAKITHPDKSTGNHLSFLNIYSSYEVLMDPENRNIYDQQYQRYYLLNKNHSQSEMESMFKYIPSSRLRVPTNISLLMQHGLLSKRIRSRHIKHFLNIDYDMELYLEEDEFERPIVVEVPVTARAYCPECLGSDTYCQSCRGVGSYKTNSSVEIKLFGGIFPGFIITVDLRSRKPGNLLHFKKNKLLIKVILS